MDSLDGKVIIITGAGRGLGREHALLLASEGARVVVNDLGAGPDGDGTDQSPALQVVEEIRSKEGEAVANGDDVSSWEGGERLVGAALTTFGRLDGLVNNAGVLRDSVLVNLTEEDWEISLRVNLRGHVAPTRAAARHWRQRAKSGTAVRAAVVNTSSESGVFANAGQSNYAAAKSGVACLTEVWAKELGRYGVRVNAILPRARTRLTEASIRPAQSDGAATFDTWEPGNVSPVVGYLLSDACELTGQVFLVTGQIIQWARPWELDPHWRLEGSGRWSIADLTTAVAAVGAPDTTARDTGLVH